MNQNDDADRGHVRKVGQVHETSVAFPLTVKKRTYFSSHHLWAAAHFVGLAKAIENEHDGERSRFNIRHRAYVTNAIFSSAGFLEAAVNELYQDAHDDHESYASSLDEGGRKLLSEFWAHTEQEGDYKLKLMEKYQSALRLLGHDQFARGNQPYQDANLVVTLRNALVHYKPKTLGGEVQHNLVAKLNGKFPENGLIGETADPWFPDKCLGYGCAAWAHKSVKSFADDFFDRIGLEPNYQRVQFEPAPEESAS